MDGFLLSLLLVVALASGGRDQMMVAQWSEALGRSAGLLVVAALSAAITAAAMAWVGGDLVAIVNARAKQMMVAFALGMAALSLAWPVRLAAPREPTRSLPALFIVLVSRQIGDSARFGIFALALWTGAPVASGLGGALGGAAAVGLAWAVGAETLGRWPLRAVRLWLAGALLVAALFIGLDARFAPG